MNFRRYAYAPNRRLAKHDPGFGLPAQFRAFYSFSHTPSPALFLRRFTRPGSRPGYKFDGCPSCRIVGQSRFTAIVETSKPMKNRLEVSFFRPGGRYGVETIRGASG
jgi:hypothetical protein